MTETENKLLMIAATVFKMDVSSLKPEMDFFKALGINSMQALALLSELEKQFGVEIPDYELQGVTTFKALAEIIDTKR